MPSANRTGKATAGLPSSTVRWPSAATKPGAALCRAIPPNPGNQPIECADGGADLAFRHDALDIEHPEQLLNSDNGDLQVAIEAAARRQLHRASTYRDHVLLHNARLDDLDPTRARLPFPEPHGPGLRRYIGHAVQQGRDVGVDRFRGERMEPIGDRAIETQDRFDQRNFKRGAGHAATMQLHALRREHDFGDAHVANGESLQHE